MNIRFSLAALSVVASLSAALPSSAQQPAERKKTTVGTIDLDAEGGETDDENNRLRGLIQLEKEEKKRDPYFENQDEAIEFFQGLGRTMAGLARGEMTRAPEVKDGALMHVAAAYLLCSIKRGICPDYLEALREVDVINAALGGGTRDPNGACPTMRRFWQQWINNDSQKKMEYQVHMSHMRARNDFNQKKLPAFVPPGCDAAVKELAAQAGGDRTGFFSKRYQGEKNPQKAAANVEAMLKLFKQKNVHLFSSTMP